MLERVRKLEQARAVRTPFDLAFGSFDAFEVQTRELMDEGKLDRSDILAVLTALRRWHVDGVFAQQRRGSGVYTG
jgi:hypothetical protein